MYTHATFNLNPRASLDRHAAAQFHSRASTSITCTRTRSSPIAASRRCEKLTQGNFRRRNGVRAVDAPGLRARPRDAGDRQEEPAGPRDHDGPARLHLVGRMTTRSATTTRSLHREGRRVHRRRSTRPRAATPRRSAGRNTSRSTRASAARPSPQILPWLRGQVSQQKRFIGTVQDDEKILRFVNSKDAAAPRRTRHELPGSFPAHQDQAALRRLESADGGCRVAQAKARRRPREVSQGLRALLPNAANTPTRPRCATRIRRSC